MSDPKPDTDCDAAFIPERIEFTVRKRLFYMIFILLAFLLTCAAIATGSYFSSGLNMVVGEPSEILVRAPREVVNERATEANRLEAQSLAEGLQPVYAPNEGEWVIVSNNLRILRASLDEIRQAYILETEAFETAHTAWQELINEMDTDAETAIAVWEAERTYAIEHDLEIPPRPIIPQHPPEPQWRGEALNLFAGGLATHFNSDRQDVIVNMDESRFMMLWASVENVAYSVQTQEVIHNIDASVMWRVRFMLEDRSLDREVQDIAEHIVVDNLMRNAVPNEDQNYANYWQARNNYETIMINEGDILVDIGWIVTQYVYDIMEQLDMLAPNSLMDVIYPMLGVFFLTAVLFLASLMYLSFYRPTIGSNKKEALLLFTLYTLTLALVWTFSEISYPFLPILIFPVLTAILIDRRCAAVLTFCLVIIGYFVVEGDLTYLLFYITAGFLICMLSRFTTERTKIILVGLLVFALQFALSVAITFIIQRNMAFSYLQDMFTTAGFAALLGLLTVIVCMGSLPFWETFFGVVTPVKLLDLTNPTNLLLRRLTIEAPGTYHHSLIVANLAETAAYDIGANAHAARVGGYYHDVGKLKFPHYFVENLDGENPHDHLDPINSAQLIMSHVSYGLTLASEHRLPQFVRDMIKEHHGNTLMQFFYSKARESGSQVEESDFRYPFIIPQSRESACVMLADSVEAAVRSMIPKIKSVDEVEKTIRFIIRGKLNDGQLAESELSIRDVTIIEQSFTRVLKGMYHERIAYPAPKQSQPAPPPPPAESESLIARPVDESEEGDTTK